MAIDNQQTKLISEVYLILCLVAVI